MDVCVLARVWVAILPCIEPTLCTERVRDLEAIRNPGKIDFHNSDNPARIASYAVHLLFALVVFSFFFYQLTCYPAGGWFVEPSLRIRKKEMSS